MKIDAMPQVQRVPHQPFPIADFVEGLSLAKEPWRTEAGGVCQVPLYIKLSDEVGKWGGDIRKARLPDRFLVDYVRVYDLVEKK